MKSAFSALLAAGLFLIGFRRRVLRRNLLYIGIKTRRGFRWNLYRAASRDFFALLTGASPSAALRARSARHLELMRNGSSLLLTAHFHNWELLGSELRRRGIPLLGAALPLRSAWAEAWLQWLRRRLGVPTVSEGLPRAALRHLEGDGCFGMLWDQHAPASEFCGRFFGRPVLMNPLPFFLLRHRFCPVYFGALLPDGELRLLRLLSRTDVDWENKLMRRYHRVLETLIRRHPEHWFGFFHARFKNSATYPGHRKVPALVRA